MNEIISVGLTLEQASAIPSVEPTPDQFRAILSVGFTPEQPTSTVISGALILRHVPKVRSSASTAEPSGKCTRSERDKRAAHCVGAAASVSSRKSDIVKGQETLEGHQKYAALLKIMMPGDVADPS
jgi:hypothetical protein